MTTKSITYDFAFENETISEEYVYRGFNIKVAYMNSRFGRVYTAVSNYGEPLADRPTGYLKADVVKRNIESFIDQCID